MSEQNKDNISQFFQKAVHKPKIKFVDGDWKKLEARLDATSVAGAPKYNHWKTAFVAAVVLLFVSTALLLYTRHPANTIAEKTVTGNVDAKPTLSPLPSSKNKKPSSERQYLSTEAKKPDENTIHSSHLFNVNRKEVKPSRMNNSEVSDEPLASLQNDDIENTALVQNAAPSKNMNKGSVMDHSSETEATNQSLPGDSSSKGQRKQKDTVRSKTGPKDSLADLVKPKPSRWNVMLSLSPDFSSTDMDKFTTPGRAFGIAAYYSISRALSVSAGVVKSSKIYWDDGYEYKPVEPSFWGKKTNGVVPSKIEGSCSVLEIPIGLQYYIVSAKKNKLYLASTFSSYIMLKESYQYIFDSPNPGAAESWNAKKISYSLFSIANFAVGYERSISDRMMIGVSPYIKIPMSGIGAWANVKLYSTGAAFTLRYQFQKKKKPDRLIPAD